MASRILLGFLVLAAVAGTRGEPLTPGELGTARFRAAALTTLREKVEADRAAVDQVQARLDEGVQRLDRCRSGLDRFLRDNGIDPAQVARGRDPTKIEFSEYFDDVASVMSRERARAARQLRESPGRGSATPDDVLPDWSSLIEYMRGELHRRVESVRQARDELAAARDELDRAQARLDGHLQYYDEAELRRIQALLAGAGAEGGASRGTTTNPDDPAAPGEAPPSATAGGTETGEAPAAGFGNPGAVAVEPIEGTEAPALPSTSSEALLARFNDACSVRNWALAEATLAEAERGASWYASGVRALHHERERAAEGDQLHLTRSLELESAMLAASRRGDWTAVQAFAAQARQAGCPLRPEAQGEIQRLIDQQRRQQLIDLVMQQRLHQLILNPSPFEPLHGQPQAGPDAHAVAPSTPVAPQPAKPHKPTTTKPLTPQRAPTGGGPVRGVGGT